MGSNNSILVKSECDCFSFSFESFRSPGVCTLLLPLRIRGRLGRTGCPTALMYCFRNILDRKVDDISILPINTRPNISSRA